MRRKVSTICGLLVLACFQIGLTKTETGYPFDIPFEAIEVPVYHFESLTPQVHLRMDYASSRIETGADLYNLSRRGEVYEVDLVFTKYPLDSTRWKTGFNRLLNDRLRSLFALDHELRNKEISWRLVLQTKCDSEEKARGFFHGFVLKYKVTRPQVLRGMSTVRDVEKFLSGMAVTKDTSVLSILDRNKEWKDALVVMDWTGSMYAYGAQVVLWHKLNMKSSGIKHMVLFNDGNKKSTQEKYVGRTGGIYYTPCMDLEEIVETISTVMFNGYGGDNPENDLEAVMRGLRNVEDYEEVVLIADNKSTVRDMALLKNIDKPVRVVLCGSEEDKINPHYLEIAFKTRGSLHTVEEDIISMASMKEGDMIEIQGFRYKVRAGNLEPFE